MANSSDLGTGAITDRQPLALTFRSPPTSAITEALTIVQRWLTTQPHHLDVPRGQYEPQLDCRDIDIRHDGIIAVHGDRVAEARIVAAVSAANAPTLGEQLIRLAEQLEKGEPDVRPDSR